MDRENNATANPHQPPQQYRLLSVVYSELGHTLFKHERYAEAGHAFRQAIRERGDAAELQVYLAEAFQAQKLSNDALRAYLEAVRLSPRLATEVLPIAHRLLDRERAKPLNEWLEGVWRPALNNPDLDAETRAAVGLFLGRVNLYCENFRPALADFKNALASKPDDVFSLEGMGEVLWREGETEAAVAALKMAMNRADQGGYTERRATTRYLLARILMQRGDCAAARPVIEQGLELDHTYRIRFQILLSQAHLALHEPEQALAIAQAILERDRDRIEAHTVCAEAFYDLGEYEKAVAAAHQALELTPTHLPAILIKARALIAGRRDIDLTQAIRLLQVYVRERPSDAESQRLLIRTLREAGRSPEEMAEAVKNAPRDDQPSLIEELAADWLSLAHVRYRLGEMQEAMTELDESLGLESDYARAAEGYRLKADILTALARPTEEVAEAYYEAGRRRHWNNEHQSASDMFARAVTINSLHQPSYWYWADTLMVMSYTPAPPYVDKEKILGSLSVWEEGYKIGRPSVDGVDFSWAYITRALMNDQLSRLYDDRRLALYWEAIVYLNRSILLLEAKALSWGMLGRFHRGLENEAAALQATHRALEIDPDAPSALDERAGILTNMGDFVAAQEVIAKRLSLEPSEWLNGVKALTLFFQDRYQDALALLEEDSIWNHNLRANCYHMLNDLQSARKECEWVWERRDDPAFDYIDNRSSFGWAAYHLATLLDRVELYDEAVRIFKELSKDSSQRVGCDIGIILLARHKPGDVEKGEEQFEVGIRQAINARELEGILKFDLPLLEQNFSRLSDAGPAREVVKRIKPKMEARRDLLASEFPRSAEDEIRLAERELKKVAESPDGKGDTQGWARLGADVELARLRAGQKMWNEAATAFQRLLQLEPERFPEARIGLETALDGLQKAGDQLLKEGKPAEAIEQFEQAHRFAAESATAEGERESELLCRIGYVKFALGDFAEARRNIIRSLQIHRARDTGGAGKALGDRLRSLLTGVTSYWALDDELRTLAEASVSDQSLRDDLAAARMALADYPDEFFRLSSQSGDTPQTHPVLTPIAVELGAAMIPEDTSENWSLFKKFIPEMRERILNEMGVRTPGVRFRGSDGVLSKESYIILLDEIPLVQNSVQMSRRYCPASPDLLREAGVSEENLIEARLTLTGQTGCWIGVEDWELVSRSGLELWEDPLIFMIYDLEALLRRNLADFLVIQEVENMIEGWKQTEHGSKLIEAVLPDQTSRLRFSRLLRALVKEMVSIAPWERILEAVQSAGWGGDDIGEIARAVRLRLKEFLPGNNPSAERLELPGEIEEAIGRRLRRDGAKTFLAIPPEETQEILTKIRDLVGPENSNHVLVADDAEIRPFIRRLVEIEFPDLMVISHEEALPHETDVVSYGAFHNE